MKSYMKVGKIRRDEGGIRGKRWMEKPTTVVFLVLVSQYFFKKNFAGVGLPNGEVNLEFCICTQQNVALQLWSTTKTGNGTIQQPAPPSLNHYS